MKTTSAFEKGYVLLNDTQKNAVDSIEGPVMVIAGPGTGKTTMLTLRIANILQKTDAQPEHILVLTFTNSGVHAIRKKLLEYVGDVAYRINIFTFHAFAEHIIKTSAMYFPTLASSNVITDLEKVKIIEEILAKEHFETLGSVHDPFLELGRIKNAVQEIKQEGLTPDQYMARIPDWEKQMLDDESLYYKRKSGNNKPGDLKVSEKQKIDARILKAREIGIVFTLYQKEIEVRGLYDFSDMILHVLQELERNEHLRADLQESYQYILVDEHQDTNIGQNRLLELLTDAEHLNRHPNLFTVGDEKQSIYRFQGASEETFNHLHTLYDDITVISLEENYRSPSSVLDAGHALIEHSVEGSTRLVSQSKSTAPVHVHEFSSYKFEIIHLAKDVKTKIDAGISPKEIAVIYRSNKHIHEIQEIFQHMGVPYTILSKEPLLSDIHINQLITLLRVVKNPDDSHMLGKALFIDFLGFDAYEIMNVLKTYNAQRGEEKVSLFKILVSEPYQEHFGEFVETIKQLISDSANMPFTAFLKLLLDKTGYLRTALSAHDSQDRLMKLDTFFDEIKRQQQHVTDYTVNNFLEFVDAYKKYNLDIESGKPDILEGVQCVTAHKSKGLEFEYVYIIDATRSSWEKRRGGSHIALPLDTYKGDIHDERRLFYVAMTRAKKELYISSSKTDWEGKAREITQFVSELDETCIDRPDMSETEKTYIGALELFLTPTHSKKHIFEQAYISGLFLERGISVTALNNFLECPIKYFFRNLLKLPSEYTPILVFGNVIHRTLELFFTQVSENNTIPEYHVLETIFLEQMDISSLYNDVYDRYKKRGLELLKDYHDEYNTSWHTRLATERSIKRQYTLPTGETITLNGKIDKIEFLESLEKGPIRVVDYKTGKPFSEKNKKSQKEDLVRQLIFYHMLFDGYHDNAYSVEYAVLDFLEKSKKGEFEQHMISATSADIESLQDLIAQMVTSVTSGDFLRHGCKQRDCEYCVLYKEIERK